MNEYEQQRRQKMEAVRALGMDPRGTSHPVNSIWVIQDTVERGMRPATEKVGLDEVSVGARIVLKREMGNLHFLTVRESGRDLQVGISKKRVDEQSWKVAKLLDLGDIIYVPGILGRTKTGELTLWAKSVELASKCLNTPPDKHDGLKDVEARQRHRHVDLFTNVESMQAMLIRSRVVRDIRDFFDSNGFVEVETPILQEIPSGAKARPFKTLYQPWWALGEQTPYYLRIAPELNLKRLLVGGLHKVFEIGKNFRNEGISTKHNPEFTVCEAYQAFSDWQGMASLLEKMISDMVSSLFNSYVVERILTDGSKQSIDFTPPWRRVSVLDLVLEARANGLEMMKDLYTDRLTGIHTGIFEQHIEHTLINPTFVTHLDDDSVPLAKASTTHPGAAECFELIIGGMEVAPGYTEQSDPDEQLKVFQTQSKYACGQRAPEPDLEFIEALKYGMPPAGGMGIGIDRLAALLAGVPSVKDVILFPMMPKKNPELTIKVSNELEILDEQREQVEGVPEASAEHSDAEAGPA